MTPRRRFLLGGAAALGSPPAAWAAAVPAPQELTRASFAALVGSRFAARSLVDDAPLGLELVAIDPLPGRPVEERSFTLSFVAGTSGGQGTYALSHPALAAPFGALLVPERHGRMVATFNRLA